MRLVDKVPGYSCLPSGIAIALDEVARCISTLFCALPDHRIFVVAVSCVYDDSTLPNVTLAREPSVAFQMLILDAQQSAKLHNPSLIVFISS